MLKSLYIKDYAIIDELNIEFNDGFNVFTGETGSGKSIIVGALSYLIKGKADPSLIRKDADKTIIEGVFTIEEYMKEKLNEVEIDYDDELIVRRIISKDNHNSIKINQCSVTLAFLTDLLQEHVDIHSQKDSQFLLNKNNHLYLLDRYSKIQDKLFEYQLSYNTYKTILDEYNQLENNTYNEEEIEYLNFNLKELEAAKLDINEEDELINLEKRYKSSEKYINSLQSIIELYDSKDGVDDNLNQIIRLLNLEDNDILNIKNNIESINYSLKDEIDKIKNIFNTFTDQDINIDTIEERLYTYSKLKRKYNTDTSGLIDKEKQLRERIRFFEDKDFVLSEKKKELDKAEKEALSLANELHDIRFKNSIKLEKQVVSEIVDLLFENVQFHVDFKQKELGINGIDDVEFLINLNKNEDLKPLRNVASGGEISRFMLALKSVFASISDLSLIIFDEIDTGVSGKAALTIGQKMATIAKNKQVLTITHLAAVAACADHHYYIYKVDDKDKTKTLIKELNREEIIKELANISSADNSDISIKAAEELYNSAQESIK